MPSAESQLCDQNLMMREQQQAGAGAKFYDACATTSWCVIKI